MANGLRSWVMAAMTGTFLLLYVFGLIGWLRAPLDDRLIGRIEPLIFAIVGYYFGRIPSEQNESVFKDEITRQTQRADAAEHAREQLLQEREALEEKLKNAKAALTAGGGVERRGDDNGSSGSGREDALRQSLTTVLNILSS
jgi:hypothetical protein